MNTREATLQKAQNTLYDVIVIGGGITGAGVAREAAQQGLKVLLIEKGDFASGTSSKSGKLIHGGLRYLEKRHYKLVFEACAERYNLAMHIAPHLVKPILFFVPCYITNRTPRWLMMVGVYIYTLLAALRNLGTVRLFDKQQALEQEKLIASEGLRGAVGFYDCRVHDSRLVIDIIKSARTQGANLLNYCEACLINIEGETKEISAYDSVIERRLSLKTRVIINAGGAWADRIIALAGESEKFNLHNAKGIHILLEHKALDISSAIAFESPRDGRNLYAVPWGKVVLVGTTDSFATETAANFVATGEEIDYLLEALDKLFPEAHLQRKHIIASYAGIRPLIGSDKGLKEDDMPRDFEVLSSPRGIISVSGGKLTTYRLMAKCTLKEACRFLEKPFRKQAKTPIAGGAFQPQEAEKQILALTQKYQQSPTQIRRLFSRYGLNAAAILDIIAQDPSKARYLAPHIPYSYAEIDYFIATEFVESVGDILFRRSAIALFDRDNGLKVVDELAEYIGSKLGWSQKRIERDIAAYRCEIATMRQAYAPETALSPSPAGERA